MTLRAPLELLLEGSSSWTADTGLDRFLSYVQAQDLTLYPAQEEALLEIFTGKNVILNTPTGSGKSLVATAMHFRAMADGARSFYTSPIKALVSEKFFALCKAFGAEHVGMITGDARVNGNAPIICCTAEILSNMALRDGADTPVDVVIMDEFHYYADRERGFAWQVPLLTLRRATFLLMSATLGATDKFQEALTNLTGKDTAVIKSATRPVPLTFEYKETPLHETLADLVTMGRAPIYLVNFTQRSAAEESQNLLSVDFCTKDEKRKIAEAIAQFRFDSPYGKEIQKLVRHGVGIHHAGLLPKYRLLVEKLAQQGLLKVISGTDTLGVGVNVPLRTVLLTQLCKYDGEKTAILTSRDFHQISGRAGRKGFDNQGWVIAQAPEHVIENLKLEAKAEKDPSKKRKIVKKKPPERGYVHWDKGTFERLISSPPEPLVSRFALSHAMILNVLERPVGGCRAVIKLVKDCHDTAAQKRQHGVYGRQLYRSLVEAKVVELVPAWDGGKAHIRVNVDLQPEFSLNQALSLYLLDTLPKVPREDPAEFALNVLTLVESILENPDVILFKQLDKIKSDAMAEMKAAGVEYDERIAELQKLEYPKPHREFIYESFNAYAKSQPWVGQNIRPKSIAREMAETFSGFSEYIKLYGLQRSEGVLLRYLSDVYKTLAQTIPQDDRTEAVESIIEYFRSMIRRVDGSLLEEWERLRHPEVLAAIAAGVDAAPVRFDITRDNKRFQVMIRNRVFELVRAIAAHEWELAGELAGEGWDEKRFQETLRPYFEDHERIRTDAVARNPAHLRVVSGGTPDEAKWVLQQTLVDPEEHNDWVLELELDITASRESGAPEMRLDRIGM